MTPLKKLQKQQLITVSDAAIVVRKDDGKVKVKQAVSLVGAGAMGGAFWGMLFGVIFFVPLFGAIIGATMGALSGSTILGDRVTFGGHVLAGGHLKVCDDVRIAGNSGRKWSARPVSTRNHSPAAG